MFVGTYYLRLFNAHAMILIFHIFMNVNKLCLITINLELLDQNVKYIYVSLELCDSFCNQGSAKSLVKMGGGGMIPPLPLWTEQFVELLWL